MLCCQTNLVLEGFKPKLFFSLAFDKRCGGFCFVVTFSKETKLPDSCVLCVRHCGNIEIALYSNLLVIYPLEIFCV
jgi:hypothetical protein